MTLLDSALVFQNFMSRMLTKVKLLISNTITWLKYTPSRIEQHSSGSQYSPRKTKKLRISPEDLIKVETLQKLRLQLGEKNFTIVLQTFRAETVRRQLGMAKAAASGDLRGQAHEAHCLSSSYRTFGLLQAADVLGRLEYNIKMGGSENIHIDFTDVLDLLERSMSALNQAVGNIATKA